MKIEGKTLEEWIEYETRERITTHWGQPCKIKPVIHPEIFGDGLQLCYLGTLDQRPDYWLIRIDSSIDITTEDFDYDEILLTPLEEEFGRAENWISEDDFNEIKALQPDSEIARQYDDYNHFLEWTDYPNLSWSGGYWGTVVNFGVKCDKAT